MTSKNIWKNKRFFRKIKIKNMFKIHHIAISVSNIGNSLSFYENFGFSKILYWKSEDSDLEIMHLRLDDFILELFCFKDFKNLPEDSKELVTDLPQIWVKHFWLQVENIEEIRNKFLEKWFIKDIKINLWKTGIKYFFIKDPDWILLEFVQDDRNISTNS